MKKFTITYRSFKLGKVRKTDFSFNIRRTTLKVWFREHSIKIVE